MRPELKPAMQEPLEARVKALEEGLNRSPETQTAAKIARLYNQLPLVSSLKRGMIWTQIYGMSAPSRLETVAHAGIILGILGWSGFEGKLAYDSWQQVVTAAQNMETARAGLGIMNVVPSVQRVFEESGKVITSMLATGEHSGKALLGVGGAYIVNKIDPVRRIRWILGKGAWGADKVTGG